jgi:competence protein ComEC
MKSKIQKIPFLRLLLPLTGGIILQERFRADDDILLLIFILLSILLILIFLLRFSDNFRWNVTFGILISCILCFGGMKLTENKVHASVPANLRSGCIMLIPEEKGKTYKVVLGKVREKKAEGWFAIDGKMLVYINKDSTVSSLEPGDLLIFYSSLQVIEGPANPGEFNFSKYCQSLGIYCKTYLANGTWKKLNGKAGIFSLSKAEWIRMKLIHYIQKKNLINESLINSLLLGYREGLTGAQQQYFAASGAMHILAVSGMHVAIIYGALVFIAGLFFRRKSKYVLLLPLPVVWLYALITGMTPSVSRSAIMISMYVISRFLNRKTEPLNIILASGFFMILAEPQVIHQVSFQLSYAAVTGISLVFQGLYSKLKTASWFADQIISVICLSIAAQLFTFPLSIFYFHQFPNYFLITNLFAVPLSGIILIAGLIFFAFFFSPSISTFFAFILDKITGLLDTLTGIIGNLPLSSIANISIDVSGAILIYIIILLLCVYFRTRKILSLHLALAGIVLLCGETCCEIIRQSAKKEMIVLSVQGNMVINLVSGRDNLVVSDDTSLAAMSRIRSVAVNYWSSLRLDEPEYILMQDDRLSFEEKGLFLSGSNDHNFNFIQFCDAKIGILNDRYKTGRQTGAPIKVDLLIINSKYPVQISEIINNIIPASVVINRNVPKWIAEEIEDECIQYGIPYHNIYKSGYFKLSLF